MFTVFFYVASLTYEMKIAMLELEKNQKGYGHFFLLAPSHPPFLSLSARSSSPTLLTPPSVFFLTALVPSSFEGVSGKTREKFLQLNVQRFDTPDVSTNKTCIICSKEYFEHFKKSLEFVFDYTFLRF